MSVYSELLKDPRWQRRRLEIMERDGWACQDCGDSENTLAVHHLRYHHGRLPWDMPDGSLVTVCCLCHELLHSNLPRVNADHPPDDSEPAAPLCGTCGEPVTNEMGFGRTGRTFYCDRCACRPPEGNTDAKQDA
jgi:5-methylcytosine-specific restriction endonuclease McrA